MSHYHGSKGQLSVAAAAAAAIAAIGRRDIAARPKDARAPPPKVDQATLGPFLKSIGFVLGKLNPEPLSLQSIRDLHPEVCIGRRSYGQNSRAF